MSNRLIQKLSLKIKKILLKENCCIRSRIGRLAQLADSLTLIRRSGVRPRNAHQQKAPNKRGASSFKTINSKRRNVWITKLMDHITFM